MTSQGLMLRSRTLPHLLAIAVGAAGCVGVAIWAKNMIEDDALTNLDLAFSQAGHDWADVTVDGLAVTLSGMAPDEATRFAALSVAGTVVDTTRVIDAMEVAAAAAIRPPEFSIEMLKNEDGVSLIGLVPLSSSRDDIVAQVDDHADGAPISDLLETADFKAPDGWERALEFGIEALEILPRSKVSISASRVAVTAVAEDADDKRRLEQRLNRDAPPGLKLELNVSAPRPVVAPFTLRFLIDDDGPRFDACAADSEAAQAAIVSAAIAAGATGQQDCILGLGTPSTRWGEAAVAGIEAVAALGRGTFTMSNADVTLLAKQGTAEPLFERTAAELEAALPPVFSLSAVLPPPPEEENSGAAPPPEFTATRSPEGEIQLRGRLGDTQTRAAVESFAAARFPGDRIYAATRLDEDLPTGWPGRVLAAVEALSFLHNGAATVTEDNVVISGATGQENAQSEMARILSARLEGTPFELDVTYSEALDPLAALPTPDECIELINEAGNRQKITFAPSSTDFEDEAVETIDAIAEILRDCQTVQIEIGGHTDSQGREVMNEQLSQARADAVLNAIMARRVLVSNLTAQGYGESQPIADNDTEAGREANRRIEFRLVTEGEIAEADAGDETGDATSEGEEPEETGEAAAEAPEASEGESTE